MTTVNIIIHYIENYILVYNYYNIMFVIAYQIFILTIENSKCKHVYDTMIEDKGENDVSD